MRDNRIHWIDIAKGMAIIFVVIGHVVVSYHNVHQYENSMLFNFSNQFVYSFHMALFMMLSGLLVGKQPDRKTSWGGYYNKIIAYGIPYLFFSFIWWAFKMLFSGHVNSTLTIRDLLLIPLYPISFMWFLYALLIMVLIQIWIGGRRSKAFKVGHILIALILYYIQPYFGNILKGISFNDLVVSDVMKNYVYFLIGVYGSQFILSNQYRRMPVLALFLGGLLVAGNVAKYQHVDFTKYIIFKLLLALIGCCFFMLLGRIINRSRILEYVGENSLPIYVLQGLCIAVVRQGMQLLTHGAELNEWVAWSICVLLGTIIPLFIYWISTKVWKFDFVFRPTKYIKY